MVRVLYHHLVNGCLWEMKFAHRDKMPVLPEAGDLVTVFEDNGSKMIDAQMVVDRHYIFDKRTGEARFEILLQHPEEAMAECGRECDEY